MQDRREFLWRTMITAGLAAAADASLSATERASSQRSSVIPIGKETARGWNWSKYPSPSDRR